MVRNVCQEHITFEAGGKNNPAKTDQNILRNKISHQEFKSGLFLWHFYIKIPSDNIGTI